MGKDKYDEALDVAIKQLLAKEEADEKAIQAKKELPAFFVNGFFMDKLDGKDIDGDVNYFDELVGREKAIGRPTSPGTPAPEALPKKEMVNHPDHYQGNKFEVIDIIEDYDLGFHDGNAIKYILRAGKKGLAVEDWKKAIWYLERLVAENE